MAFISAPVYSQTSFKDIIPELEAPTFNTIPKLESIGSDALDYKIATEEILKILYAEENWPRYFAYAKFYRNQWPLAELSDVVLLEPLALLRHCQDEAVLGLTRFLRSKKNLKSELDQIDALAQTQFKGKKTEGKGLKPLAAYFEGKTLWKADENKVQKLHPKNLAVKVGNRCDF